MKILIANNLYQPFNRGGAETVVEKMKNNFECLGHQVDILSTKPFFSQTNTNNITIRTFFYYLNRLPKSFRIFWLIGNIFNPFIYLKLNKIILKNKPDLVITNNLFGLCYYLSKLLEKNCIPQIHFLHDIQFIHPSGLMMLGEEKKINSNFAKIYQAIIKSFFNRNAYIVSPSNWLLQLHKKNGFFSNLKCFVLPFPFKGCVSAIQQEKKNKSNYFLYAGQIESHKGIFFLLEVFRDLNKIYGEKYNLKIAGQGSQLQKAKTLFKNFCIIEFLGLLNQESLLKTMSQARALIVPSICYENSPAVIYDAKGLGLPILGADIGGISEIINPDNGELFKAGNKQSLIEVIDNFFATDKKFYQTSAVQPYRNFSEYCLKLLSIIVS